MMPFGAEIGKLRTNAAKESVNVTRVNISGPFCLSICIVACYFIVEPRWAFFLLGAVHRRKIRFGVNSSFCSIPLLCPKGKEPKLELFNGFWGFNPIEAQTNHSVTTSKTTSATKAFPKEVRRVFFHRSTDGTLISPTVFAEELLAGTSPRDFPRGGHFIGL
ncbi:hypothetical protein CDAR_315931 [Caerostris darwini]|uniref:Uncharacterized protein n=1 Tax=Caerostris darwini TaxID=1538125 RepID=A0AAV4MAV0_9ARAC|nr:hypothetical protein CDAR_315931 [Caerostris darwini]